MRIKYSKDELIKVYDDVVAQSASSYKLEKYEKCLKQIEAAAFMQYNLNFLYTDIRLDNILLNISDKLKKKNRCNILPETNNIIFFDSFALDNKGLTQQYLDGLVNSGYKILFVHETIIPETSLEIKKFLLDNKIEISELGYSSTFAKIDKLFDLINNFRPSKVFLHLKPWSTLPLIVFNAFSEIKKYQINLTDHAFWLGSKIIDYSLEFRNYGSTVSIEKRGLNTKQLLVLPFYPWQVDTEYKGLPGQCKNKTVLFSGGSLYKINDGQDTFFHIVRKILERHDECVFLLAGTGNNEHLNQLIRKYNLVNRFFLIGNRKDIYQVLRHVDIYIDTYPITGALMAQYAALSSLPILSLKTIDSVEEVVCTKKKYHFVFQSKEELLAEADKLIIDREYRLEQGQIFRSLVADQNDFRKNINDLLSDNTSNYDGNKMLINYSDFTKTYVESINRGAIGNYIEIMVLKFSLKSITLKMALNLLFGLPKILLKKLFLINSKVWL